MISILSLVVPPALSAMGVGAAGMLGVKYMAKATKAELDLHIADDKKTHSDLHEKVNALHVDVAGRLGAIEAILRERLPNQNAQGGDK